MNCREVKQLLVAYLDNEVNPSERTLIRSHLAGCDSCHQELAALSATRNRLAQSLKTQAAQAAPSSQALSRLQARLADEAQHPSQVLSVWPTRSAPNAGRLPIIPKGKLTMKKRIVLAVLAGLLLITVTAAFVPGIREQVARAFAIVVSYEHPIPLDTSAPGYLEEFQGYAIGGSGTISAVAGGDLPGINQNNTFTDIYQKDDKFLIFTTTETDSDESLPDGEAITVNGQPGVLNTGLSGEFRQEAPEGIDQDGNPVSVQPIVINYADANKLTWMVGGTRYEMLSNLPVENMAEIAAELAPAP